MVRHENHKVYVQGTIIINLSSQINRKYTIILVDTSFAPNIMYFVYSIV